MPKLTNDQQRFVVRCKANDISDSDIIAALLAEYPEELEGLTKQNLEIYDPKNALFRLRLGAELKAYFIECRKEAEDEVCLIPIANKATRLRILDSIVTHEDHSENPILVAKVLEQAAKEMGGMYQAAPTKAAAGSGAISGGTSGAGSRDPEGAEELVALRDELRTRKDREVGSQGVSGGDSQPGTPGAN